MRASRAVSPSFANSSARSGSPSSGTSASTNGSNRLSWMLVSANRAVPARTDAAVSAADSPTAVIIPAPTTTTLSGMRLRGLERRGAHLAHPQRLLVTPERRSPDQHDPVLVRLHQDCVEVRRDLEVGETQPVHWLLPILGVVARAHRVPDLDAELGPLVIRPAVGALPHERHRLERRRARYRGHHATTFPYSVAEHPDR